MTLFANAGVPMLGVTWGMAWFTLIPVVFIESLVALKSLGIGFRRSLVVTGSANIASTLVGIPLTWIALAVLQGVLGGGRWMPVGTPWQKILAVSSQPAWLAPYEHELGWMIPGAALILCIPFYFASVFIEYLVICRMVTCQRRQVMRFCWLANLATYSLIAIFWGAILAASL